MQRKWLVIAVWALAGCQVPGLSGPSASTPRSAALTTPDRLGGVDFGPLSDEGARLMGAYGTSNGAPTPATSGALAGSTSGSTTSVSMSGGGSPMSSLTSFSSYGASPLGPMKLDRVTEAKTVGCSDSLKQVLGRIVNPIVGDWAQDAALVTTSGYLGEDGKLASGGSGSTPSGWYLSFVSQARQEAMLFFVTAQETRILLLHWVPVAIDLASLSVDTSEAIQTVLAAIKDPQIKSKEELLGQDFFYSEFGGNHGSPMGGASVGIGVVAPAPNPSGPTLLSPIPTASPTPSPFTTPAPAPDATHSYSPLATASALPVYSPPPYYLSTVVKNELLPALPPGGSWNARLNPVGRYLVWELNYAAPPSGSSGTSRSAPPQAGDSFSYVNGYVYAMVDARTGDLIRISRPTKTTVTLVQQPYSGIATASPTPRPVPLD